MSLRAHYFLNPIPKSPKHIFSCPPFTSLFSLDGTATLSIFPPAWGPRDISSAIPESSQSVTLLGLAPHVSNIHSFPSRCLAVCKEHTVVLLGPRLRSFQCFLLHSSTLNMPLILPMLKFEELVQTSSFHETIPKLLNHLVGHFIGNQKGDHIYSAPCSTHYARLFKCMILFH